MSLDSTLYKIALGIGHHFELTPMLDHAMAVFKSELPCVGSIVCSPQTGPDDSWHMVEVHTWPKDQSAHIYASRSHFLPQGRGPSALSDFYGGLPSLQTEVGISALILPLPDFGALILDVTQTPLDDQSLKRLEPTARHLARACCNCMAIEDLKLDAPDPRNTYARQRSDQSYLDQLFENAQLGIVMAENDGTVIRINPEFERIFGYTFKECVGNNIDDIVATKEDRSDAAGITRSVSRGQKHSFEARRQCKDGSVKHVAVMASPIVVQGKQVAVYAFYRDVTIQRQTEAELFKAKQLEATGQLAGGIAHDFNNLLSVIIGNIEVGMIDLPMTSPAAAPLTLAKKFCLQAHDLTQKFITFSSGGQPLKKRMGIGPLLREVADKVFDGQLVSCRFDLPEDLWLVDIDADQFRHVLSAIYTNAIEAMPKGGEVVIVGQNHTIQQGKRHAVMKMNGPAIQVDIKDNGIGVTDEAMPQLFDPYYSTKKTANQTGLGMGLTVAHSILSRHQGTIQIESQENAGTCVSIYLPAIPE